MKNALRVIGFSLVLLSLVIGCKNSFTKPPAGTNTEGNVLIRIANPGMRTILPATPVFNKYELSIEKKGGGGTVPVNDTSGIEGAGVTVEIPEGTWIITLLAYQDILKDGVGVLAAKGSAELVIAAGQGSYTVEITIKPIPIGPSVEKGLFSYNITLPVDAETATLTLTGTGVDITRDLIDSHTGSASLAPGFYDLTVILMKNNQSAGVFESVHIYSGLESRAVIDLSGIVFADKVFIAGTLNGLRLGTVKITGDAAGNDLIEEFSLDSNIGLAERAYSWVLDIPVTHIGGTVYAVQEFNGMKSAPVMIDNLQANGKTGVVLNLVPGIVERVNVAPWYSIISSNGGTNPELAADGNANTFWNPGAGASELVIDYGFDVTVNFSRLMFHSASGTTGLTSYSVDYWNGGAWVPMFNNGQVFAGSTDGSVHYNNLFPQITAQRFRWKAGGTTPAVIGFALYKAIDRTGLIAAVEDAEIKIDLPAISDDGKDVPASEIWVTQEAYDEYLDAINDAIAALDNPYLTAEEISEIENALAAATEQFNNAQQNGLLTSGGISYIFTGPQDETITLTGAQTLSWIENTVLQISVTETFDSYQWYVNGIIRTGAISNSITLNAQDFAVATHTVTLRVMKNGIPYTKTLTFTVQ